MCAITRITRGLKRHQCTGADHLQTFATGLKLELFWCEPGTSFRGRAFPLLDLVFDGLTLPPSSHDLNYTVFVAPPSISIRLPSVSYTHLTLPTSDLV